MRRDRPTLDGKPWEWTHGFYPTEQVAIDTYNRLYPEGKRSGVVGNIERMIDEETGEIESYRLDLSRWPDRSREESAL